MKKLGGGLANQMRALGYRVTPPSDPEDGTCWEVQPPHSDTILLAKNAAEGWEKANQHWHQQNLAKMKLEPQEVEPFQREERYIVIKRKRLTPAKEDRLREFLHMEEIGIIECAVVESDWPEYETVWAMIERRVTGAA